MKSIESFFPGKHKAGIMKKCNMAGHTEEIKYIRRKKKQRKSKTRNNFSSLDDVMCHDRALTPHSFMGDKSMWSIELCSVQSVLPYMISAKPWLNMAYSHVIIHLEENFLLVLFNTRES